MKTTYALIALGAMLLSASPLWAQAHATQSGHELDANPSTTGGPINQRVDARINLNRGNYLVTGQAGLGRSLRIDAPYSSFDQFQGNLGTTSLYNFRRDSVSAYQATRGPAVYSADPIYVYSSSNVVSTSQVVPSSYSTGASRVSADFRPISRPSYVDFAATSPVLIDTDATDVAGIARDQRLPATPEQRLDERREELSRLRQFEQSHLNDLQTLYEELLRREGVLPPVQPTDDSDQPDASLRPQQRTVGRVDADMSDDMALLTGQRQTPIDGQVRQTQTPAEATDDQGADVPARQLPARKGEDIYVDLLRRAEELATESQAATQQPAPRPAEGQGDGPIPLPEIDDGQEGENGEAENLPELKILDTPLMNLGVRVDSFASTRPNLANVAIRRAEQLIAEGRFYNALSELQKARKWDPGNPLVLLRMSHAHFGAGEFYSATLNLRRAMAIFPSVASVKTDLAGLLDGGRETFDKRLGELKALAQSDDQLYTLLCYLQYASGRTLDAVATAKYIARTVDAKEHPQSIRLAEFVIAQSEPPRKPAD